MRYQPALFAAIPLSFVLLATIAGHKALGATGGGGGLPLPTCKATPFEGTPCGTAQLSQTPAEITPTASPGDATATQVPGTPGPETPPPTTTETATATPTPSPTPTPTLTPTPSPSATPTPTPTPVRVLGDVNCDFETTAIDAALVLQFGGGLLNTLDCPITGDINGDTRVNSIDAAFILQYTAGLISDLPPTRILVGTIILVEGQEAFCFAVRTASETWVLWDSTGLSVGDRVRVTGFVDPFAAFCGITPLFHNTNIVHLD